MQRKIMHVVGDKFAGFVSSNPDVISASELERIVERREVPSDTLFVVGLGVQDDRLLGLQQCLAAYAHKNVHLDLEPRALQRASDRLSHKHVRSNTLVSHPYETETPDVYEASLLVDDRCAEMSDHVTGQHLQGMLFIEAARQMFLAVSECYLLRDQSDKTFYFVINCFNVSFHAFAFPLRTRIRYHVLRKEIRKQGTLSSDANVTFLQGETSVAEVLVKFTSYENGFLAEREATKAREAILETTQAQLAKVD